MKALLAVLVVSLSFIAWTEVWTTDRFESFLRNSGRFFASDFDEDDVIDEHNRNRDAVPLFLDVMEDNGWSTNDLVRSLISVVSNGLTTSSWESSDKRRSVAVAVRMLSDINHPAVTNFFCTIATNDLHGLEKVVIPGIFKYTHLEQEVIDRLRTISTHADRYDKAASIVAWDLLDCLAGMPEEEQPEARARVAKFMYYSMRQVSSSQTWQDGRLARLIPSYSNSVQRLEQARYMMQNSTNTYERSRAEMEYNRLSAIPTNQLNSVSWICE